MSTNEEEEKAFRTEVRNWLKFHKLNIPWLASWIEKSENTVRNFIYGTKPISKSNMVKIKAIMEEYDNEQEEDFLGNLAIRPNHRFASMNPNFDPSQNKIKEKTAILSSYISDATSELICKTDAHFSEDYSALGKVFFLKHDVYSAIKEGIRQTIKNYIDAKGCNPNSLLTLECPKFSWEIRKGESPYRGRDRIIIDSSKIKQYAPIASAIAGEKDVDSYINNILYDYLMTRAEIDFASFLSE